MRIILQLYYGQGPGLDDLPETAPKPANIWLSKLDSLVILLKQLLRSKIVSKNGRLQSRFRFSFKPINVLQKFRLNMELWEGELRIIKCF